MLQGVSLSSPSKPWCMQDNEPTSPHIDSSAALQLRPTRTSVAADKVAKVTRTSLMARTLHASPPLRIPSPSRAADGDPNAPDSSAGRQFDRSTRLAVPASRVRTSRHRRRLDGPSARQDLDPLFQSSFRWLRVPWHGSLPARGCSTRSTSPQLHARRYTPAATRPQLQARDYTPNCRRW